MSVDRRQLQLLLANALRMDFRPRGAAGESRLRRAGPFLSVLLMYGAIGATLGLRFAGAQIPLFHLAALLYTSAGMLVVLNLMVEYQEILFSPVDAEILGWRPIDSLTLYVARVLHILVYVTVLTAVQLAVPCVVVGLRDSGGGVAVALAFALGALLNTLFVTAAVVLLHGVLLRRLSPERFQDVLGWVQMGFMVSMLLGYQLLTPHLIGAAFGERSPLGPWFQYLPAGWYAALPVVVSGAHDTRAVAALLLGGLAQVGVWGFALRRLAGHELEVENARAVAPSRREARPPRLARLLGRGLGREPLRLLGFDFFLAQLRGDRRLRVGLLPLVAFPVALTLAGLILGRGADPYALTVEADAGLEVERQPPPDQAAPAQLDPDVETERMRGRIILFTAIYTMSAFAATIGNLLGRSHDWRGAWVFHAAPLERYDQFYSGVMWGVVYALLLPAVALVGLLLLLVWRDPMHVVAHLTLPAGLALLGLPLGAALQFEAAFTREPLRHSRGAQLTLAFAVTVPLCFIGALHYLWRGRTLALAGAGLACMALGALAWRLAARRFRTAFARSVFDG